MPITIYNGRENATQIAGNTAIVMAPVITDMAAPKVSEIEAGVAVQCSVREISPDMSANNATDQWLCDLDEVEIAGSLRFSLSDITILTGDPQKPDPWLKGLTRGQTVYVVMRRGLPHADAYAASQVVQVWKCKVTGITPAATAANNQGNKFEERIVVAVDRFEHWATVAA